MSSLRNHNLPAAWYFAVIGALASLPVTAFLNWLPNSEATIGGGIMIIGAFTAGVIAAIRSSDPSAAGLRAGFIGGVLGLFIFIVTVDTTVTWQLRVVFFVFASGVVMVIAPLFGFVFGCVGGWVTNTVASRWTTSADSSQ